MRWPWQRATDTDPKAQAAVADAETKLSMQHRLTPTVDQIAERFEERRHQNRFAEMLEEAIQLRRQA